MRILFFSPLFLFLLSLLKFGSFCSIWYIIALCKTVVPSGMSCSWSKSIVSSYHSFVSFLIFLLRLELPSDLLSSGLHFCRNGDALKNVLGSSSSIFDKDLQAFLGVLYMVNLKASRLSVLTVGSDQNSKM